MKLKKFINKSDNSIIASKFDNCTLSTLKKGDILEIGFFQYENKRKGGNHFRIDTLILMLNKIVRKRNNLTFNLTALHKNELVTVRVLISGTQVVKVKLLKKNV